GGITVLFFLPMPVSVSHAGLAQIFLCLVVTVAVATSRWWRDGAGPVGGGDSGGRVATLATATTALIYLQILLGAVMRHSGAGLAIPDFPLVFGGLVPPRFDFSIGVHYAHRVGALVVATAIFWTLGRVLRVARREPELVRPAVLLAGLVLVQGTLGAVVVLTGKAVLPNTLHVGAGAVLLATSLVLTLRSRRLAWRGRRSGRSEPVAVAARPRLQQVAP
ncbi:MAG: COX15/CtaA family protein, partial [Thermoanaerobaculia bacterium]